MLSIGESIKKVRKDKGWTQEQLSQKTITPTTAGISPVMISQYERGVRVPKYDQIQKLATALDVPISELIDYDDDVTGDELQIAAEWLQDYGFEIFVDGDDDKYGRFQIAHFDQGTVATMDRNSLIGLREEIISDSIEFQERYIQKRLNLEFMVFDDEDAEDESATTPAADQEETDAKEGD